MMTEKNKFNLHDKVFYIDALYDPFYGKITSIKTNKFGCYFSEPIERCFSYKIEWEPGSCDDNIEEENVYSTFEELRDGQIKKLDEWNERLKKG